MWLKSCKSFVSWEVKTWFTETWSRVTSSWTRIGISYWLTSEQQSFLNLSLAPRLIPLSNRDFNNPTLAHFHLPLWLVQIHPMIYHNFWTHVLKIARRMTMISSILSMRISTERTRIVEIHSLAPRIMLHPRSSKMTIRQLQLIYGH